jgi:hypothetical protein
MREARHSTCFFRRMLPACFELPKVYQTPLLEAERFNEFFRPISHLLSLTRPAISPKSHQTPLPEVNTRSPTCFLRRVLPARVQTTKLYQGPRRLKKETAKSPTCFPRRVLPLGPAPVRSPGGQVLGVLRDPELLLLLQVPQHLTPVVRRFGHSRAARPPCTKNPLQLDFPRIPPRLCTKIGPKTTVV